LREEIRQPRELVKPNQNNWGYNPYVVGKLEKGEKFLEKNPPPRAGCNNSSPASKK